MKYKVGDKVKIVSLQREGRGCCMDVVGDIGEIIEYDPSSILKYKVKIEDGGRWWWEESNLELIEVEFRAKQKEALDYFFKPYYDKQQQEKDELKALIASKMEEVDALVKQLNRLNQM